MKRLKSCLKRAQAMGRPGSIDKAHPLAPAFFNMKMFLDGREQIVLPSFPFGEPEKFHAYEEDERVKSNAAEGATDLVVLDWFAMKVDDFAKAHMLSTDTVACAMLHEWRNLMPFGIPKKKK